MAHPRGAQGRDSYWEGQSSSPAAPEALAGEGRSRDGITTRLALVGFPVVRLRSTEGASGEMNTV
jgi:hypothetical protein